LAAVFGVVLFTFATVGSAPVGVLGVGAVAGARLALQAAGLVLVYRANRVINFAQLAIGSVAGTVFLALVQRRAVLQGLHMLCGGCLPKVPTRVGTGPGLRAPELAALSAPHWLVQLDYLVSAVVAIALAVLLVWLTYTLLIKRFTQAPRLVLTVAMLGAGLFVQRLGMWVLTLAFRPTLTRPLVRPGAVEVPVNLRFSIGPAVFRATDIATIVLAVVVGVGLVILLRRSAVGVVLRGSAENPSRAQTLGVNVAAISSRAWLLAGALSGLASVLVAAKSGSATDGEAIDILVRASGAAVVGGFVSFPVVLLGALAIGVIDQVVVWNTDSQALVAGLVFVLILTVLLVQRSRASRAEVEAQGSWEASREIRPIPKELAGLDVVRRWLRVGVVIAAVVCLGYPWAMSPGQVTAAVAAMVTAMIGLSLLILTGWAGQISLGQMAFAAVGAFVAASVGLPFPLSLVAGGLAGAAVAVVVGIPSLRLRGLTLAVSTLALGLAAPEILFARRYLGHLVPASTRRPLLLGVDFNDERAFYYLTLVLLALVIVAVVGLRRSAVARVQIAAKDNEQAAQSLGINLYRTRLVAFAISGFIAAFAGGILVYGQRGVHLQTFRPAAGVGVFLMTIIGGLGSIAGPILGALYGGVLDLLSGTPLGALTNVLLSPGIGVIVLLVVLPGGLAQGVFGMRDAWLRRIASRYRIEVPSLVADRGHVEGEAFPLAPKLRATGTPEPVPVRYRTDGQWMVDRIVGELRRTGRATRPRAVRRA
jgi:branched-chain amino acid transport system permease protein